MDMTAKATDCGVSRAIDIIGGKWTLLILRDLIEGPCRFGELQQSLTGISTRTLAQRLDELAASGIIDRDCGSGHPVYTVSAQGAKLQGIIEQLRAWGSSYEPAEPELRLVE